MLNPLQQYVFMLKLHLTVNAKGSKIYFIEFHLNIHKAKSTKLNCSKKHKDNARTFKDIWSTDLEPKPE